MHGAWAQSYVPQVLGEGLLGAEAVEAGDLDGEGGLDLAVVSKDDSRVALVENLGATFAKLTTVTLTVSTPQSVQMADLDDDGDLDLLVAASGRDDVVWLENLGGASFAAPASVAREQTDFATYAVAGDVDGDGDLDVATCAPHDDEVSWFANLGAGRTDPEITVDSSLYGLRMVQAGRPRRRR